MAKVTFISPIEVSADTLLNYDYAIINNKYDKTVDLEPAIVLDSIIIYKTYEEGYKSFVP